MWLVHLSASGYVICIDSTTQCIGIRHNEKGYIICILTVHLSASRYKLFLLIVYASASQEIIHTDIISQYILE